MLTANKARQLAIDNNKLEYYLNRTSFLIETEAKDGRMCTEIELPDAYLKPVAAELKKLGYRVEITMSVMGLRTFRTLRISWK